MNYKDLESRLGHYLNTEESCRRCLGVLSPQSEIQIIVDELQFFCVHPMKDQIQLLPSKCVSPDFTFYASAEAIEIMIAKKGLSPAQLGLKLCKQYFAQQVHLEMGGHFLHILRKGYLKIVAVGGAEFLQGLTQYNLGSLRSIIAFLRQLGPR